MEETVSWTINPCPACKDPDPQISGFGTEAKPGWRIACQECTLEVSLQGWRAQAADLVAFWNGLTVESLPASQGHAQHPVSGLQDMTPLEWRRMVEGSWADVPGYEHKHDWRGDHCRGCDTYLGEFCSQCGARHPDPQEQRADYSGVPLLCVHCQEEDRP